MTLSQDHTCGYYENGDGIGADTFVIDAAGYILYTGEEAIDYESSNYYVLDLEISDSTR